MLLIHGMYRFGLKKIGVRRDICYNCREQCIAERWKSFHCFHLFWIPLIPLGTRREWTCTLCGADPRRKPAIGVLLKILGVLVLFILGGVTFSFWVAPASTFDPPLMMWGLRFGLPVVCGVLFKVIFFSTPKPQSTIEERRAQLEPLSVNECFYCHGPLEYVPDVHCPTCKVTIYQD